MSSKRGTKKQAGGAAASASMQYASKAQDQEDVPEFLELTYGRRNNYVEFVRTSKTVLGERFGIHFVHFIQTGNRYVYAPGARPAEDAADNARANYDALCKAAATALANHSVTEQPKIYTFLWKCLSDESQSQVMTHADFQTAEDNRDPYALWSIIKAKHETTRTGIDVQDKLTARKDVLNYVQEAGDNVSQYKVKLEAQLKALDAVNAEAQRWPEAERATLFIEGLGAEYLSFKENLYFSVQRGGE